MDRAAYNACMSPYIRGKDKTKEERQRGFCVGAKVCSGKAKTEEEAAVLCNAPHLPKWAAKGPDEEEKLTCPQKTERVLRTITEVKDLIKSGKTDEIKEPLVTILQDIHACAPEEVQKLANDMIGEIKKTAGEFYFKGEGREMVNGLKMLEDLLGEKTEVPNGRAE
jgi:hypothetical protein